MREPDRRRLTRPRAPCPCLALLYGDSEKPAESGGSVAPRAAPRKVACTCDQKPCSCPKADVNYAFLHATGKRAPAGQDRAPSRRRLTPRMVGAGSLGILHGTGRAVGPGAGAHQEPGPPSVSEQESAATTPGASAAFRIGDGSGLGLRDFSALPQSLSRANFQVSSQIVRNHRNIFQVFDWIQSNL